MGTVEKKKIRDTVISVKLTKEESELVESLALYHNISKSELLRLLIATGARDVKMRIPSRLEHETT